MGTPGVVAAAARLVADNGTLPLATVLGPAIALAEAGFAMYQGMYDSIMNSVLPASKFAFPMAFLHAALNYLANIWPGQAPPLPRDRRPLPEPSRHRPEG